MGEDLFDCDPVLANYYMMEGVRQHDEASLRMKELRDRKIEIMQMFGV